MIVLSSIYVLIGMIGWVSSVSSEFWTNRSLFSVADFVDIWCVLRLRGMSRDRGVLFVARGDLLITFMVGHSHSQRRVWELEVGLRIPEGRVVFAKKASRSRRACPVCVSLAGKA